MDINVAKYRLALGRLRLSSHHLGIEQLGRHSRPIIPPEQRFCSTCTNKIDDEVHFLTECKKYRTLRNQMLSSVKPLISSISNLDSKVLFVVLMNTDSVEVLVHVGKFIHNAWKKEAVK